MKLMLFALIICIPQGCSYRWTANPVIDKSYENCQQGINNFPQMVFIPGYKKSAILVDDCKYFRREKIAISLQAFELSWDSRFGKSRDVSNNLNDIIIVFSFEKRKSMGYTTTGELIYNANLLGATISKNSIWIHVNPSIDRVCDTSLVHELVHASIWSINKAHGDPDHTGQNFLGWTENHNVFIQNLNKHLCKLGI